MRTGALGSGTGTGGGPTSIRGIGGSGIGRILLLEHSTEVTNSAGRALLRGHDPGRVEARKMGWNQYSNETTLANQEGGCASSWGITTLAR